MLPRPGSFKERPSLGAPFHCARIHIVVDLEKIISFVVPEHALLMYWFTSCRPAAELQNTIEPREELIVATSDMFT